MRGRLRQPAKPNALWGYRDRAPFLSFLFVLLKGWAGWFPTARIERPPFYRGGSASNGNLPGYPVFFCGSNNFPPFLNTAKIA